MITNAAQAFSNPAAGTVGSCGRNTGHRAGFAALALNFLKDIPKYATILLRFPWGSQRDLGRVSHDRQRGPKLMGRVGRKPAGFFERALQPRDHAVERRHRDGGRLVPDVGRKLGADIRSA